MTRTDHRAAVSRAGLARMAALALLWGSSFLWIKLALRGFNPVQIVFARVLLGFVVLAPLALSRGLGFPRGWRLWGAPVRRRPGRQRDPVRAVRSR